MAPWRQPCRVMPVPCEHGAMAGPRHQYLTVYGRKPVLEALDGGLPVARVHLADGARGDIVADILQAAKRRGVQVNRVSERRVSSISRNGKQDQGVVADVAAPAMQPLIAFLEQRTGRLHATSVLLLDGIHNPSNVGMILRSATAAGVDGIVVPDAGTAEIGPMTIKASAGVAFKAPILRIDRAEYAAAQLADARFELVAVEASGDDLFTTALGERVAFVLGNETTGITSDVAEYCHRSVSLPLANGVESLNVAATASILAYEIARRRSG